MARYRFVFLFCLISMSVLSQIQSTSIQLINNSTGKDTYTNSSAPTADNSGEYVLSTYVDGSNAVPRYRRSYLKIDLSSIPQGAIIVDADLRLTKISGYDNTPTELSVIVADWQDDTTDHHHQPNVVYTSPSSTVQVPIGTGHTTSSGNYYSHTFDVTDQVQYMSNYSHLNFGWRLKSEDESVDCQYFTDINGNTQYVCDKRGATYRSGYASFVNSPSPILFIDYVLPIEVSLNTVEHADVPNSSNGSISINASQGNGVYSYQWIDGSTGSDMPGETGTTINGLLPGWYGVRVTDGLGNVSYMAFIVGVKCGGVEIEFKPDGRFIDDTNIYNLIRNGVNYGDTYTGGSVTRLYSENWTYGDWYFRKSLLKFNLQVPQNINLESSNLHLFGDNSHLNHTGSNTSVLRRVTSDWEEDVVTYNICPTSTSSGQRILAETTSSDQDEEIDVVDFMAYWQQYPQNNYGMLLELSDNTSNSYRRRRYYSSDINNESITPKLVLKLGKSCLYSKPKKKLDGVKYKTVSDRFYFSFQEEYYDQSSGLSYRIYDEDRMVVLDSQNQGLLSYHGDNRLSLNTSSLTPGAYVLEIENNKEELFYLRFTKP